MPKQTYWVKDLTGVHAQVEGVDQRDYWTKVQGWSETGEPSRTDQVHVEHPDAGRGQLPYGAIVGGWDALGWLPTAPPEPVDLTKDPQLVDQPAAEAVPAELEKTAPASGTTSKEKTRA